MKIVRFAHQTTEPRYGVLDGADVVVLADDPLVAGYDTTGERIPVAQVRLLAPIIPRSKIIGVGRNYAAHAAEKGNAVPDHPLLFFKPNTAVIGPHDPIVIPAGVTEVEPEAELAIVIGRLAKSVPAERWADYVFGYTIGNDVSSRAYQRGDGQWARAKGLDTFCPLGPCIETELDPEAVTVSGEINGVPTQQGNTRDFIFRLPELIETITAAFTLLPGDVILTGTPAGVAPIAPGDTVKCTVEGIGSLVNPVVAG
jgi:2-keto-4-pentenoate hydratase/2-oxohepta-3-ene-1,7-dioic acid hydratase in catechol pathway